MVCTVLVVLRRSNYADCVRTLLSWGANLAIEDALGRTVQDMVEEYALDDVSALLSGLWTHIDKYRQSAKQYVNHLCVYIYYIHHIKREGDLVIFPRKLRKRKTKNRERRIFRMSRASSTFERHLEIR